MSAASTDREDNALRRELVRRALSDIRAVALSLAGQPFKEAPALLEMYRVRLLDLAEAASAALTDQAASITEIQAAIWPCQSFDDFFADRKGATACA